MHVERYQLSWDDETACFYLFNLSGQFVGYQQYRPFAPKTMSNDPKLGRYYTYCERGKLGMWGLETFYYSPQLYLTEGVFDAVRIHNLGLSAVAVLSNDPRRIASWLRVLNRKTIAICDGDSAGKKLAKFCDQSIIMPAGKDLGDLNADEVSRTILAQ